MFFFRDNKQLNINMYEPDKPDYCEFEKMHTFFNPVKDIYKNDVTKKNFVVVYQCMSCKKFICIEYDTMGRTPIPYDYNFTTPDFPFDESTTKVLEKLSPRFIKVYKQASVAEKSKLDEIDKASYRKSIEILINDFLRSNGVPDDNLKDKFLSQKIRMLPDNELFQQSVPQLIAWIGNDGSHAYEKHPQLTVDDMKKIIHSFVICLSVIKSNEEFDEIKKNLEK